MSTPEKIISTQPTLEGTSPGLRFTGPDGNHYPERGDPPASRDSVATFVSRIREELKSRSKQKEE